MSVSKSQRVLIAVSFLSSSNNVLDLYNFIERSGLATIDLLLKNKYKSVEKLKDANATKAKFLNKLSQAASNNTVKAIDVIIMLHGRSNKLYFYNSSKAHNQEGISTATLEADIKALNIGHKLRLVYSTACYGASHNDNFVDAGFCTSVGAKRINTNSATEFPIVLANWGGGEKISTAISRGEFGHEVSDTLARFNPDWSDADSDKEIYGRGALRIDSNP